MARLVILKFFNHTGHLEHDPIEHVGPFIYLSNSDSSILVFYNFNYNIWLPNLHHNHTLRILNNDNHHHDYNHK